MAHAETCPVCNGKGTTDRKERGKEDTCHGCGGCGWITVNDPQLTWLPHEPSWWEKRETCDV